MNLDNFYKAIEKNKVEQPWLKNSLLAFISGGLLGVLNQGLFDFYKLVLHLDKIEALSLSTITIVFVASIFTLVGFYKKLGKVFGAGLFIPTTGFANSITSSAIEGRDEGLILGVGSKMFSLAGAVITYGVVSSILFLVIKFIIKLFEVML